MNILAIDIGGTSVKTGVFSSDLQLILSESVPTKMFTRYELLIDFLCDEIGKFQKSHGINSIGIGIPGSVNRDGEIINASNIPIIEGLNIKKEINVKISSEINIPVYTGNDANVAALYESRFGVGAGFNNFIYVTLGTGIGAAIVLNGEVFRGDSFSAGEIGFVMIDYDGEKKYLEDFIGRGAFLEYAKSKIQKSNNLDIKNISDLADNGNDLAVELIKYYGKILGLGLVSAMNLLDIPNVVIGGGVSACTDIMYEALEREIKDSALPNISNNFEMRKSKLLGRVGLFGAATLAMSQK